MHAFACMRLLLPEGDTTLTSCSFFSLGIAPAALTACTNSGSSSFSSPIRSSKWYMASSWVYTLAAFGGLHARVYTAMPSAAAAAGIGGVVKETLHACTRECNGTGRCAVRKHNLLRPRRLHFEEAHELRDATALHEGPTVFHVCSSSSSSTNAHKRQSEPRGETDRLQNTKAQRAVVGRNV